MMPRPKRPLSFLIVPLLIALLAVLTLVGPWVANNDSSIAPAAPAPAAPEPRPLPNAGRFIDPAITLAWDWSPGLDDHQTFAVRVWFGDEAAQARETWTDATTFEAADAINSYAQPVGDFYWQVAVINLAGGEQGGFESMASAWSPVQTLRRVRHISPTPLPAEARSPAAQIVADSVPAMPAPTARAALIDAARQFVYSYSNSEDQDSFAADYSDALAMMAANAAGAGAKPRLLCDGQATAMLTVLAELGIDSRLIFLYRDDTSQIGEHTVLEVFNDDAQAWELHDVLSNRFFVDENGDRASIERVVFGDLDLVSVCEPEGDCTPLPTSDYDFRGHFEAFRYGHTPTFWVNPDRFDVSKRFPGNGNVNLAEYETGSSRDFVFQFDSWTRGE